jgi:hypothetical protein
VWGEDETIGWVYQFFNGQDERRKMREESQAPRNSRELAVRNQFFTPRYVVQFLTDNTLGRIWYEMRGGEDGARRPLRVHGAQARRGPRAAGEEGPARPARARPGLRQRALPALRLRPAARRSTRRPGRTRRAPKSEATGKTLAEDYASLEALGRRCRRWCWRTTSTASTSTRAARRSPSSRCGCARRRRTGRRHRARGAAEIRRSNIVVAEPLVADDATVKAFVAALGDAELGKVFVSLVESLKLAGDLGLLLRVEKLIDRGPAKGQTGELFAPPEARIRATLAKFVGEAEEAGGTRRRLFAEDAAQGMGLLEIAEKKYDTVLMNPPFGDFVAETQGYIDEFYSAGRNDIYAALVLRASEFTWGIRGCVGALTSRAFVVGRDHRHYRRALLVGEESRLSTFLDLGAGVLDGAMVETAAYVIGGAQDAAIRFLDTRDDVANTSELIRAVPVVQYPRSRFLALPGAELVYDVDAPTYEAMVSGGARLEPTIGRVTFGLTTKDDQRFVRLRWEVNPGQIGGGRRWVRFSKGGEYAWFTSETHLVVNRERASAEIEAFAETRDGNIASTRRSSSYYFRPAVAFSRRSQRGFSARRLQGDACFSDKTAVIVPSSTDSPWLLALPPVLASQQYQGIIVARSKFGSYEIGPIKELPVPEDSVLAQSECWEIVYRKIDEIEQAAETAECYRGMVSREWNAEDLWGQARIALIEGLRRCGLELDENVSREIDAWARSVDGQASFEQRSRSHAVGVCFGRFLRDQRVSDPCESANQGGGAPGILVEDEGHVLDLVAAMGRVLLGEDGGLVRQWLRNAFFAEHLARYSKSKRKAPIYWQLATPSASYSVWLYIHAFTKDTMFHVEELVNDKVLLEERKANELRNDAGESPSAAARKAIAAQDAFLEELRGMAEEVRRVKPLWKPDLDDGVVINFAPLWRLVPQHKAWQKELRETWAALCAGEYDWSHLAMHLWPERVVPKCATDRSFAIAHGLEDVFWLEDANGKWKPRATPTRPVADLIAERTSAAVTAARDSLIAAPTPGGGGGASKRRRAAPKARRSRR